MQRRYYRENSPLKQRFQQKKSTVFRLALLVGVCKHFRLFIARS